MSRIVSERVAAVVEGDFVVFLIGMRINKWWRPDKWLPVARAMPRMLRELEQHPEMGLLGYRLGFSPPSIDMVQYWRSFDALREYAKRADAEHWPAWKDFYKRIDASGAAGIWHETFMVHAGEYEAVYKQMPRYGLGQFGDLVPATGRYGSAIERVAAARAAAGLADSNGKGATAPGGDQTNGSHREPEAARHEIENAEAKTS